ncbi:MAG: tRNA dihydrouridine synthase DusB [Candidatus Omnitrophica bacterium]|nr:tRNA dihydrouridine synthase DusB [Candidatus Omnitrophota bacterium]MDD5437428.1 tRNA dihydrouridine synthase DusB [Candidatus Omnitrophota bacterium]
MLKIGSYKVPSNVLLAPMAGCADLAFRLIAREHGARFCFFEMIDCNSVTYGSRKRLLKELKTTERDKPIALQLLGTDPDDMLSAARKMLEIAETPFLDINAACPVKKVIKKHAGAYLLNDPKRLCAIIKTLAVKLPVPVTVKLRAGYEKNDPKEAAELAKRLESSGAAAIFVHGRTRSQMYSGGIDYDSIRAIKDAVRVPVFGSGNVFDAILAEKMLKETSCDGVLVARGALGNPWIFDDIDRYFKTGVRPEAVTLENKKKVLKKHLAYIDKYKDTRSPGRVGFMRKMALWYLRGFPNAAETRHQISLVNSYEKMIKLIDSL